MQNSAKKTAQISKERTQTAKQTKIEIEDDNASKGMDIGNFEQAVTENAISENGNDDDSEDRESEDTERLEREVDTLIEKKRYKKAIEVIDVLIKDHDSTNANAYIKKSKCWCALSDYLESLDTLVKAVEFDSTLSLPTSNSSAKEYEKNKLIMKNSNDI